MALRNTKNGKKQNNEQHFKTHNATMKILLLPIFIFSLCIISCSKEHKAPSVLYPVIDPPDPQKKLKKEFNITLDSLVVDETQSLSNDTNNIVINGRIEGKLYVGVFNKKTKRKIHEYIGKEQLPASIKKHNGNGGYDDYKLGFFGVASSLIKDGTLYFILGGASYSYIKMYSVLYSVKNGELLKKINLYDLDQNGSLNELKEWQEGLILSSLYPKDVFFILNDKLNIVAQGNWNTLSINQDHIIPLSTEEIICVRMEGFETYLSRYNLKKKTEVWRNNSNPFEDIQGARINDSSYEINKDGTIHYFLKYARYGGEKGAYNIKINANNGKWEKI